MEKTVGRDKEEKRKARGKKKEHMKGLMEVSVE
jgi:hypothetical protein